MSPGAQNMKMEADALGTAKNESEWVKKCKTGPDALGTAENEPGSAKH
jgi:hypothetical protein